MTDIKNDEHYFDISFEKLSSPDEQYIGSGFVGGAAGGAMAGFACGPGAPVCVTIGVFLGGALAALGADFTFGWFF